MTCGRSFEFNLMLTFLQQTAQSYTTAVYSAASSSLLFAHILKSSACTPSGDRTEIELRLYTFSRIMLCLKTLNVELKVWLQY